MRKGFLIYEEMRYTLFKKLGEIFLIFKGIRKEVVAKSYMRKGFLIYEEMREYLRHI
jgi:hypothetical protein